MTGPIQLDVRCPDCGHSLMDPEHTIEGAPSVLCRIEVPGPNPRLPRQVPIRFSSIYGSTRFECEARLESNTRMRLFCPACDAALHGSFTCDRCGDPMVRLDIRGGGRIVVCTRRGCKRHFIAIDENLPGLENLFRVAERSQDGSVPSPLHARRVQATYQPDAHQEIIGSGTFLPTYCPHCSESLIEGESMVFRVETQEGQIGRFALSAYLNVFTNEHTVEIPHAEEVRDLRCIHCDHTLICEKLTCGECGSRTAHLQVAAMRKLISFHVCLKMGCHWHGMSEEDNQLLKLEDSLEW